MSINKDLFMGKNWFVNPSLSFSTLGVLGFCFEVFLSDFFGLFSTSVFL